MFKRMTKIAAILLCLAMVFALLAGCGGDSSDKSGDKERPNQGGSTVSTEEYRGTTVIYATWKDPSKNEDGPVVDNFQKETGIKVQIDMVPQETYVQEIAGKIAAGEELDYNRPEESVDSIRMALAAIESADKGGEKIEF